LPHAIHFSVCIFLRIKVFYASRDQSSDEALLSDAVPPPPKSGHRPLKANPLSCVESVGWMNPHPSFFNNGRLGEDNSSYGIVEAIQQRAAKSYDSSIVGCYPLNPSKTINHCYRHKWGCGRGLPAYLSANYLKRCWLDCQAECCGREPRHC